MTFVGKRIEPARRPFVRVTRRPVSVAVALDQEDAAAGIGQDRPAAGRAARRFGGRTRAPATTWLLVSRFVPARRNVRAVLF